MKRRTISLLALALAAVMALGLPVSAEEILENPSGEHLTHVDPWDTLIENNGSVQENFGTVQNNNGAVNNNNGTVQNNNGTVQNNNGAVNNNNGTVMSNSKQVENNFDTVHGNIRTVTNNYGTVENNFSGATVTNNYGTVKKNLGTVENNFGGTIEEGSQPQNQYYELPNPQDNFSYEDATWSYNSWWIKSDATVTIKAADGFYFESASISGGLGTITVADDHKSCTLSNVTGSLANGGLTLTVQAGEYVPEPTPTPDPRPTTPPADSTTAAEAASAPTVQKMETAERPDPQDVEATERYNFWMGVKGDLRMTADGKTLRVYVPADYTNMPASVMEQIRLLDKEITVDLRWNGERLIITPETAVERPALKAFWTFEQLCELYAQQRGGRSAPPPRVTFPSRGKSPKARQGLRPLESPRGTERKVFHFSLPLPLRRAAPPR